METRYVVGGKEKRLFRKDGKIRDIDPATLQTDIGGGAYGLEVVGDRARIFTRPVHGTTNRGGIFEIFDGERVYDLSKIKPGESEVVEHVNALDFSKSIIVFTRKGK
jgi:hypothetical protein